MTIKQVEVSIIERAFADGTVLPQPPDRLSGRTVAVVGSGPAGLAVAQQLTRAGHTVAVFERADRIGGLLRYGIPEFKMEKAVLDRRLAQMEAEGTRFRAGVDVGKDLTGKQLRDRYDAVVLAVGSTVPRDLPVPGRELGGVLQAMEFLPPSNRASLGEPVEGPGDRRGQGRRHHRRRRHGCRLPGDGASARARGRSPSWRSCPGHPRSGRRRKPWPTYPMSFRVSSAHEEGGDRVYAVNTQELVGDGDGQVSALRLVEVELVDGRFEPVPGSEREIPAQLVLLAMGFVGPQREGVVEQLGVELDGRGNVARDETFMTSVPGVFVAGDAGRGQSLIVWAIAEGRSCAAGVDAYLAGRPGSSTLPAPIRPPTAHWWSEPWLGGPRTNAFAEHAIRV